MTRVPSSSRQEIVNNFIDNLKNNVSSEHHQNNNLKVVVAFTNLLGKENSFYDIKRKEQLAFGKN
jgi:hypothetical protein